jgi:hypothetical protein
MAEPVASLLRRSFDGLARDVPASYARLVDALAGLTVELTVDGERFTVRAVVRPPGEAGPGSLEVVVDGDHPSPDVRITTGREVIVAVVDARLTLQEAVEVELVRVIGRLDDLVTAHGALLAYAHACVRAPSSRELHAALRDGEAEGAA